MKCNCLDDARITINYGVCEIYIAPITCIMMQMKRYCFFLFRFFSARMNALPLNKTKVLKTVLLYI